MRVSQKLEYAFRALTQLAHQADGKSITRLEVIAQQEHIPSNFLVQILNELKNASLVMSKRGKHGGYALNKAADDITLFDIVHAIDPQLITLPAPQQGLSGPAITQIWNKISTDFQESLKKHTLSDFMDLNNEPMFYI